jgi:hypothetical protein
VNVTKKKRQRFLLKQKKESNTYFSKINLCNGTELSEISKLKNTSHYFQRRRRRRRRRGRKK